MTVKITLTLAQPDTNLFDLYSNIDGFTAPFAVNIPKASLLSGYTSSSVPDYATTIRIKCKGVCTNYIDVLCTSVPIPYELFYDSTCPLACTGAGNKIFDL